MLPPEKKKKIPANRYRRILLVMVILVVIVAGITAIIVQKMMCPAQIVYVYYPEGMSSLNSEVMVIDADGSSSINVSNSPRQDDHAEWLADGSAIVFVSGRKMGEVYGDLYLVNTDGSNVRWLAPMPELDVRLSPDAGQTAYRSYFGVQSEIMMMDVATQTVNRLTHTTDGEAEWGAEWSPDGTQLVFVCGFNRQLCVMNADGTMRQNFPAQEHAVQPRWSPDGSRIAFICSLTLLELCVVNADGSGQTVVAKNYVPTLNSPDWSPDGTKLVYSGTSGIENYEIYSVNADGSNRVILTDHPAWDMYPDWSPDGSQITFVSYRDSVQPGEAFSEIYVMNADGTNLHRLTNHPSVKEYPQWQPNPCGAWDILCYLTRP